MRIKNRSTVYFYAITLCMGSFVFGYQLSSFSNLSSLLAHANSLETHSQINRAMTDFNILLGGWTLVGIVFYNCIKHYGWMLTFKITDLLTIAAAVIGIVNLSINTQVWSRSIFGFVTGINTILIPIFLTSILPGPMGAPAGTLNQLFIVLGIFIGFWIGNLVINQPYNELSWRLVVGLPLLPALIRQYFLHNYFNYQALQVYMQNNDNDILAHYIDRIYQNVSVDEFKQNKRLTKQDLWEQSASVCQAENQYYRIRFSVALAIATFNQLSGGAALAYHIVTHFFIGKESSNQTTLNILTGLNFVQFLVTWLSGQLLEKYGRRSFMQQGQKIIMVSLFLISFIELTAPEQNHLILILIFIHMIGFSISYGPCTFLIGTEVINDIFYPALMQWILITVNFIVVGPIIELIGLGPLCLVYFVIQLFTFLFLETYHVETQGKLRRDVFQEYRSGKYPHHIRKQQKQFSSKLVISGHSSSIEASKV